MDDYSPLQGVDSSVCSRSLTLNRTVSENEKSRPFGRTAKQNSGHLHRECGKTQKFVRQGKPWREYLSLTRFSFTEKSSIRFKHTLLPLNTSKWVRPQVLSTKYTSIQMKCQGRVIFVHTPRLFYCPKRRIGYACFSLTGN